MVHKANRPTVHDMRAMKARGEKISMLYVTTPDEAAAAEVGSAQIGMMRTMRLLGHVKASPE